MTHAVICFFFIKEMHMTAHITQLQTAELRQAKPDRASFSMVKRNPIYLVLDGLVSKHNIGSIMRMADATLVTKIFICNTRKDLLHNLHKGSRGAERWVEWAHCDSAVEVIKQLRQEGVETVALELCDTSMVYANATYEKPVCFVLGNENFGVSQDVLAEVDRAVHLPMLGMSNSLNVSTAASVIVYDCLQKLIQK